MGDESRLAKLPIFHRFAGSGESVHFSGARPECVSVSINIVMKRGGPAGLFNPLATLVGGDDRGVRPTSGLCVGKSASPMLGLRVALLVVGDDFEA